MAQLNTNEPNHLTLTFLSERINSSNGVVSSRERMACTLALKRFSFREQVILRKGLIEVL